MTTLVIDCTELYQNPVRTGIQRVVRELLRHWPYDRIRARVAWFDPARGLVPLSERAIAILAEKEPGVAKMSYAALVESLKSADKEPDPLPSDYRVFIPEVFYDHARCRFYEARAPAMLAHDFLPWLRPDLFNSSSVVGLMPYLRLISKVPLVAFNSQSTRAAYETRITRRPASGPVLTLGADGLPLERQAWRDSRRGYIALGSIDTRKNQHLVVEAFTRLWKGGHSIPLTLIGRAFLGHQFEWLEGARQFSQFRWLESATDVEIADALRTTRATIYASENEGFGLPPVESVAVGVPAVAAASCPSVAMQSDGILQLEQVTSEQIVAAIRTLENDVAAAALWREAAAVRLRTWQDFALAAAEWLDDAGSFRKVGLSYHLLPDRT